MIGHKQRPLAPTLDILFLLRQDKETTGVKSDYSILPEGITHSEIDWIENDVSSLRLISPILHSPHPAPRSHANFRFKCIYLVTRTLQVPELWRASSIKERAYMRTHDGMKMLCPGKVLVTDRLHAHVLSTLMDILALPTFLLRSLIIVNPSPFHTTEAPLQFCHHQRFFDSGQIFHT